MTDSKRMMHDQQQPHGRRFGRTLDPLDYREGFPANGVELVGAFGLDSKHDELERAARHSEALRAAKQKASNATINRPAQQTGDAGTVNQQGGNAAPAKPSLFSLDGLKGAAPYMAITAVVIVVVAHFAFGKG